MAEKEKHPRGSKNVSPISAEQRDKGVKLLLENPKLTVAQVMEACGIESNKRNRWTVQKWREKVGSTLDWKKILELCPDTGTLGGLLVDGFNAKLEQKDTRIKELENKLTVSEKKAKEWEDDAKQWRASAAQAEKKVKELENQMEQLSKKGKGKTDIEKTRALAR